MNKFKHKFSSWYRTEPDTYDLCYDLTCEKCDDSFTACTSIKAFYRARYEHYIKEDYNLQHFDGYDDQTEDCNIPVFFKGNIFYMNVQSGRKIRENHCDISDTDFLIKEIIE